MPTSARRQITRNFLLRESIQRLVMGVMAVGAATGDYPKTTGSRHVPLFQNTERTAVEEYWF